MSLRNLSRTNYPDKNGEIFKMVKFKNDIKEKVLTIMEFNSGIVIFEP
jgi:hypothetical protein